MILPFYKTYTLSEQVNFESTFPLLCTNDFYIIVNVSTLLTQLFYHMKNP